MMSGADERVYSMSHDSGFRRHDLDASHQPSMKRKGRDKASQHFEDRMKRRYETHEKMRKLMEERKAATTED
jgi:hypothetical protein